jgi:sugar lactone lactonase YvrE
MTAPLVHPETPHVAVACACALGEGPVWDHRTGTVLWVDIKGRAVWRYRPATGEYGKVDVAEPVGFVALTDDPDVVLAGFKSGLATLDLPTGASTQLARPEPDKPGNRINDGHVAAGGHVYFGTMDEKEAAATGRFWRWDGERLDPFGPAWVVTNGPTISPDGATLYCVDSVGRCVYAHAVAGDEMPGEGRLFVRFDEGWGHPDGLACDAEGHVWVCHWGGSRITRFRPDGTIERIVPVPTAQVTKCAFGGDDLSMLYITTAARGHDPHIDPMAGHLFRVAAGVRGLPANVARTAR